MKATDLMIGDWVLVSGHPMKTTKLSKFGVEYPNCEPIPLTPEILKKNNWKVDDMYAKLRLEDGKWLEYYYHESRLSKYWEGVDEWQNHAVVREIVFRCHCSYIHELQHALRLCGLTELADNFQV